MNAQDRNPESHRSTIAEDLTTILGKGPGTFSIVPLPQDASMRRYYRIVGADLRGTSVRGSSMILMALADPNPKAKPEEITVGDKSNGRSHEPTEEDLDFVNVLKHFDSVGLPVPKLYRYNLEYGFLYLEDLGDKIMEDEVKPLPDSEKRPYYEKAIDLMVVIHEEATHKKNDRFIGFGRGFDEPLLFRELMHFVEYGIEARKSIKVDQDDLAFMQTHMKTIGKELAAEPRVLVHRDFQSRNLMLQNGGSIRIIDFQDSLMGTRQYDLVSLLRDSYVVLGADLIDHLLDYYLAGLKRRNVDMPARKTFRRIFDLQTLQRKIKDAGRFDYIDIVKKNPKFLKYIPDTIGYVRQAFDRLPEHDPFREKLVKYAPELGK